MIYNQFEKCTIELVVNGEKKEVVVRSADTLLHVLREQLALTGAKPGCENGDCGACTVLVDSRPLHACMMLALEAVGHEITTVEGLQNTLIQTAFVENNAFQCGYCTSGFIMNCFGMLKKYPDADDETIEEWLRSNICRCTGYQEIKKAVKSVIAARQTFS